MRIAAARKRLASEKKLPFLCTNLINIKYLTGFGGSNGYLIISENDTVFITDSRYSEYSSSILGDNVKLLIQKDSVFNAILETVGSLGIKNLFFEDNSIHYSFYSKLAETIPDVQLFRAGDPIDRMRMVKDESEIALIKKAASIADQCTEFVAATAKQGMTEWDVSVAIENFYRTHGCRKSSFETIAASGKGSSMPHYIPSMSKKLSAGEPFMVDMGCEFEDYNSDLTRTFFVGSVNAEFERVYNIVLAAQIKAAESVAPGKTTGEIDSVARNYITNEGYGDLFSHSTGHGIGLQVHELPAVKKGGDTVLEPGMIVTIEPGIYLAGKGGIRIEDMVLVKENGFEILTHYPKKIMII